MISDTKTITELPPFPNDVSIAPLPKISLRLLEANDEAESKRFFTACKDSGFFLLNLQDSPTGNLVLDDGQQLEALGKAFFDLSFEEKLAYKGPEDSAFGFVCRVIDSFRGGADDSNQVQTRWPHQNR